MLKNLEGFFDCVGSPLSSSRASLKDIYGDLLTSLYQLDDNGNKVVIDCSEDGNNFVIDVNKPVYVGSLRDNSESNFVTRGFGDSNLYSDIASLGFKPAIKNNNVGSSLLQSFIINADEDSVLPVSYDENGDYYVFSDKIEARCLPKVNFYIYRKSDGKGGYEHTFVGGFGIKRDGSEKTGYYDYNDFKFEKTGAIDDFGNTISRTKVSVLMLPTNNYGNKFELFGHSNGEPDSNFDDRIEEYYFDGSVGYGEEVDAKGKHGLAKVKFVNEDKKYANLVPTYSCQFIGQIFDQDNRDEVWNLPTLIYLGVNWDTGVNDEVYCCLDSSLYLYYEQKEYIDSSVDRYIRNALTIGVYNTRHFGDEPMYLYNISRESLENIYIRDNTLEIQVKRLPVVNLTGKLSKSSFDPNKPYIYIYKSGGKGGGTSKGVFLCMYDDLDSDLIFQVAENYMELSSEIRFTIFCSATAPDEFFLRNINSVGDSRVYRLTCQPTKMNEDVLYYMDQL